MKFTPEVLLSAPRRTIGVPNPSGTRVLYGISAYSFETHSKTGELRVLDVETSESYTLNKAEGNKDCNWLDDDTFACLQPEKDGSTSLFVASVNNTMKSSEHDISPYIAGKIDAAAGSLKVSKLDSVGDEFAVVITAPAGPDGSLYTTEKASRMTQSTGRLYDSLYVRHWDHYQTKERDCLWYGKLSKREGGKYQLSALTNALEQTALECESFDVSPKGIIFVAKDPELNLALNTKSNVYLIAIDSWTQSGAANIQKVAVPGYEGASTSPVFDASGTRAAFLMMRTNGYESDRNRIFIIKNVGQSNQGEITAEWYDGEKSSWGRSPQSIRFSADGLSLLATVEEEGYVRLFEIPGRPHPHGAPTPRRLTDKGTVIDAKPLEDGRVLVSGTSLIDNSWYAIVDPRSKEQTPAQVLITWSNSHSDKGKRFGLSASQVSSIWTPASDPKVNKEVHSIVFKPSTFNSSDARKYPVAYLIHGGPQGSWADGWSTRWNPAVFAEQGFIVIAINPTGSTGYGQEFTDAIKNDWGGRPYEDIVKCFKWVGENMPEADNERAVALGASYGGYMMNWIQGHDLGRKFKALVCHDGIFSMAGMLATEELYFPFHDLGGTPWYDPGSVAKQNTNTTAAQTHKNFSPSTSSEWRRWDPSQHLINWSTPQLIIHSENDYRIPISEGLAPFNVLQARGVDSQFLMFPDENHFVLKPENSLAWHKVVLNWINKHVGLPAFTEDDPQSEEFWGGVRYENERVADMPTQGKPET